MNTSIDGRKRSQVHVAPSRASTRPSRPSPAATTRAIEGYWQEWTPPDPQPNNGYDAELHLPAGKYLLNASASILLHSDAALTAQVECSLFVGETNVSLNQIMLAAGQGDSISATSHVDSTTPTVVQWVCSSTAGPFRLGLAVTALKVDALHQVG